VAATATGLWLVQRRRRHIQNLFRLLTVKVFQQDKSLCPSPILRIDANINAAD
jgi:hypothetical protein